jgi:conjugal transfer mating pair stabilization protein TraG
MASELASYALSPNRHFSDGTAMPTSFAEIEAVHRKDASNDAFLRSKIDDADRANDRAVGPKVHSAPLPVTTPPDLQGLRGAVNDKQGLSTDAAERIEGFDARNEVTRNPDGTVSTKRSQVKANVRQLRDDMVNMEQNAEELWSKSKEEAAAETAAREARIANSPRVKAIEATPEVPTMGPSSGKRRNP